MHKEAKKQLVAEVVPAVVAPAARVFVRYWFEARQIERRGEYAIEAAERKHEGMQRIAAAAAGGRQHGGVRPVGPMANPQQPQQAQQNVYDRLREIRAETNCGFCYSAAEELLDSDRQTASQGLSELEQYEQAAERVRKNAASDEEIEAEMDAVVGQWEVIPRVVGAGA